MCTISNKIKFCTCLTTNTVKLRNYWILYRYNRNKEEFVLGESIFPDNLFTANYDTNKQTLMKRINEHDAFDIDISFKTKDKLEIVITDPLVQKSGVATYNFIYSKNEWLATESDSFDLMK